MTGPEHYKEAEQQIKVAIEELSGYASAASESREEKLHLQQSQIAFAAAQVHATLALAAATVEPTHGWLEALS